MDKYHLPEKFLDEGKNSTAFYSFKKPNKLLIFVHGFSGSSITTWNSFPKMIKNDKDFETTDILFYGYDSFKGQAHVQAVELYNFIDKYVKKYYNSLRPTESFEYEKVVIVV